MITSGPTISFQNNALRGLIIEMSKGGIVLVSFTFITTFSAAMVVCPMVSAVKTLIWIAMASIVALIGCRGI